MNPSDRSPPLELDDPRISEWIDGRLPAAEAAAIERAVRESPTLATLVADLRAIKDAARAVSGAAAPAGFTERVMARVAKPVGDAAETDRVVDHEWEAIEAERIALERAEAAADLAEAAREPHRRPWPWMALAAALAAGLLVAVVLNLPGDGGREVALAPGPEDGAKTREAELTESDLVAVTEDVAKVALERNAAVNGPPAPAARSLAAGKPGAPPARATEAFAATAAAGVSKSLGREPADPGLAEQAAAADREFATDVVAVTVRGPAGRAAFERRAAALGLAIASPESGVALNPADKRRDELSARRARQSWPEILVISGPADAIETLLAETSRTADRKRSASATRVMVRLIELPEPAAPQPSEPAAAEPTPRGTGVEP